MDKKTISSITLKSFPKINIGLHIFEKLSSGYHKIETVLFPVNNFYDIITVKESNSFEIKVNKDIPTEQNLCYKAYKLLNEIVELPPIVVEIEKRIPIGAGLGGGSSNAATTLIALNKLFSLNLDMSILHSIAEKIGADVPFFLYNKPMLATGIGTNLKPINIKYNFVVKIITPNIFSDTKSAYQNFKKFKNHSTSLEELINYPITEWKNFIYNDLESVVFDFFPELGKIKQRLYEEGAVYASMSGSGSAVYGLFI